MSSLTDLAKEIEEWARVIENPPFAPVLQVVKQDLAEATVDNFLGAHDPDGNPWPEPSRLRNSARRFVVSVGRQLLIDTGLLYLSATESIKQAPVTNHGFTIDPAWVWYGQFHMDGTGVIPQREFTGWGQELLDRSVVKIVDYFVTKVLP